MARVELGDPVERIAQEAALLAERSDISEEISRLRSHVQQFEKLLTASGEVGKKFDFLLQEMNREINTIITKERETYPYEDVIDDQGVNLTEQQLASIVRGKREAAAKAGDTHAHLPDYVDYDAYVAGGGYKLLDRLRSGAVERLGIVSHYLSVPEHLGQEVEVHLVPNLERGSLQLRFWWDNRMIHSLVYPLAQFPRVHF